MDTGPLVAYFNGDDKWHAWSVGALNNLGYPFCATELVVGEVCYFLRKYTRNDSMREFWELIESGDLHVCATLPEAAPRMKALMEQYERMDVADASLVVLSERYPQAKLITIDRKDFTFYRRNNGSSVPCIMPTE